MDEVMNVDLGQLITKLKELSDSFYRDGIADIYTNSKIYEVLIAIQFGHTIINGHANTLDAIDQNGYRFEYKHYKVSSSNHTWTFNDFTNRTIQKLYGVCFVFFTIINDQCALPQIEKIYAVPGVEVAKYLLEKTKSITNTRKMINISEHQIVQNMPHRLIVEKTKYTEKLKEVFTTAKSLEQLIGVDGILTSNKLWELLVACVLNHRINPEQKQHDAYDTSGRTYEYKVSTRAEWTFQDISENVLASYLYDEKIILAIVDKQAFSVCHIYFCNPKAIIKILKKKLNTKLNNSTELRRLSASIGMKDINNMLESGDALWLF